MTVPSCPSCASAVPLDLGECRPFIDSTETAKEAALLRAFSPGRLYYCPACGLGFRDPTTEAAQVQSLYRQIAADRWEYSQVERVAWRRSVDMLVRRFAGGPCAVLDVGAFDGSFLRMLPDGYRRCAIEPSQAARARLEELGIDVISPFLEDFQIDHAEQFDVVCMFDVFEHLPHPRMAMEWAMRYLRPKGWLVLCTGDCRHWTWRLLRGMHPYLGSPQHIRFGSQQFFRCFCAEQGARLLSHEQVGHHQGSYTDRLRQGAAAVHFALRGCGGLRRRLSGAMLLAPSLAPLRHVKWMPDSLKLRDHLLVMIEKQESSISKYDSSPHPKVVHAMHDLTSEKSVP